LGNSAVCHENTERNKSIDENECGRKDVSEENVCLGRKEIGVTGSDHV
jgi:hypothetical protein